MERQLIKAKKHRASLPWKQNNELWRYCACTVTQTHRQGSLGRDLSLKRAISSAPQNICILMQGWTGREGTEERDSGISYQGFTHRVREQVHGALWRISRITQTPTSAALGNSWNSTRLQNFIPIQLKSASNSKNLISPSYSGLRVIQNHTATYRTWTSSTTAARKWKRSEILSSPGTPRTKYNKNLKLSI